MHRIAFAIAALLSIFSASPVLADGEIVITQAKALAGNVTPGDTAGFPITLSQPGAYILGSNLTVPGYTYGIIATTNNVDIDMNGFRLAGNNFGTYGVVSNYGESRIHGGVINTFRNAGIYIRNNAWTIEDMKIVKNGGVGIDATNAQFISVKNSLIAANNGNAINADDNAIIKDNSVSNNGFGIVCRDKCYAEGNTIGGNNGTGITITTGIVLANAIIGNAGYGISDGGQNLVGLANNILIGNNTGTGNPQRLGGVDMHPNVCVPPGC